MSKANRVYDTFAGFRALQQIPCVDASRIGITGYSFGGIVSVDVVEKVLADKLGGGQVFKASLPVYPSCQAQWEETQPTNTKVHFLLAELDDYTPAKYCTDKIAMLKSKGWDVSHTTYTGAHHGFNADGSARFFRDAWTFKNCGVSWVWKDGHEYADTYQANTKLGWDAYVRTLARQCGAKGVTTGSNVKARTEALDYTLKFFSDTL